MNLNARPDGNYDEDALMAMEREFLSRGGAGLSTRVGRSGVKKSEPSKRESARDVKNIDERMEYEDGTRSTGLSTSGSVDESSNRGKPSRRRRRASPTMTTSEATLDAETLEASLDAADRYHVTNVLTRIFERPVDSASSTAFLHPGTVSFPAKLKGDSTGFPVAPHRRDFVANGEVDGAAREDAAAGGKPKSLFARQMAAAKRKKMGGVTPEGDAVTSTASSTAPVSDGFQSAVVDGSGLCLNDDDDGPRQRQQRRLVAEIHQENVNTLASMDEARILDEQKKLLNALDPSLIEFLRSKRVGSCQNSAAAVEAVSGGRGGSEVIEDGDTPGGPMDSSVIDDSASANDSPELSTQTCDVIYAEFDDVSAGKPTTTNSNGASFLDHLPIKPSKELVHMDEVETEKLEWLKDVSAHPTAKVKPNGADDAAEIRFDFEGRIVDPDADYATASALYHHEDQTKAGYTLHDLFSLARSQFTQQRVIALRTLSKIVFQARLGLSDAILSRPLFPHLLEAGIVFLFRWALDDSNASVAAAAIQGFHAVLVVQSEEACLDRVYSWPEGRLCPSLEPMVDDDSDDENDEGDATKRCDEKKSDVEVMSRDVVLALMQMNFLPRLRYVLEVIRPDPESVHNIFDILLRLCRHSPAISHQVLKTPRLLSTVIEHFLAPQDHPGLDAYGKAQPKAIRFLRTLVSMGGRASAVTLNSPPFSLASKVSVFVALRPHHQSTRSLDAASALTRESSRLLSTLVFFNVGVEDSFDTLFPVAAENLRAFSRLSLHSSSSSNTEKADFAAASDAIGLISAFVRNCRNFEPSPPKFRNDLLDQDAEERRRTLDAALPFGKVKGFLEPLTECCGRWMKELAEADADVKLMLERDDDRAAAFESPLATAAFVDLVAATLGAVVGFFKKWSEICASSSSSSNSSDAASGKARLVAKTELLARDVFAPFVSSSTFDLMTSKLGSVAGLAGADSRRQPIGGSVSQLPTLRCLSVAPSSSSSSSSSSNSSSSSIRPLSSLSYSSPLGFVSSFAESVVAMASIAPRSPNVISCLTRFSLHPRLNAFVAAVGEGGETAAGSGHGESRRSSSSSSWFLRYEVSFVKTVIEGFVTLARVAGLKTVDPPVEDLVREAKSSFHLAALRILPRLSDSSAVFGFVQSIVFNESFAKCLEPVDPSSSSSSIAATLHAVHLRDDEAAVALNGAPTTVGDEFHLRSAAGDEIVVARQRLSQLAEDNLTQIKGCYMDCFSTVLALKGDENSNSLVRGLTDHLLTEDWMYLPLIQSYQRYTTMESRGKMVSPGESDRIQRHASSALLFLHYLETRRRPALGAVDPTARLARIYCVFLCGSEAFFQPDNYALLASLARIYATEKVFLSRLDFSSRVAGISSFYDLFQSILEQYEAESFNDSLFASYLLFPLQQIHGATYRRLFWIEHGESLLFSFPLPLADVFIPLENFLQPPETDVALLRHYLQALLSGRLQKSPLLYLIAVTHVSRFIFSSPKATKLSKLQKLFLQSVMDVSGGEGGGLFEVARDILHFRSLDSSSPRGLDLYSDVPPERRTFIQA